MMYKLCMSGLFTDHKGCLCLMGGMYLVTSMVDTDSPGHCLCDYSMLGETVEEGGG